MKFSLYAMVCLEYIIIPCYLGMHVPIKQSAIKGDACIQRFNTFLYIYFNIQSSNFNSFWNLESLAHKMVNYKLGIFKGGKNVFWRVSISFFSKTWCDTIFSRIRI